MEPCEHCYSLLSMVTLELIGFVAILLAAFFAWCNQRRISARKGTLDFVLKHEVGNMEWRETRRRVWQILGSKEEMEKVVNPKDDEAWQKRFLIGSFLSHFEFVGAAIKNKVMDEKSYMAWNGSGYVSAWKKSKEYIYRRRCASKKPDKYARLEEYAKKWDKRLSST